MRNWLKRLLGGRSRTDDQMRRAAESTENMLVQRIAQIKHTTPDAVRREQRRRALQLEYDSFRRAQR